MNLVPVTKRLENCQSNSISLFTPSPETRQVYVNNVLQQLHVLDTNEGSEYKVSRNYMYLFLAHKKAIIMQKAHADYMIEVSA